MKKVFFAAAIVLLTAASCSTKQSAINDLRSLNQKMQISGDYYSINDWEKAGKEFYSINKRIAKHAGKYNDQQLQEISELNGECVRSFTDGAINKVQGAVNMVKGFIGGFLK